jgi:hypothetical protein
MTHSRLWRQAGLAGLTAVVLMAVAGRSHAEDPRPGYRPPSLGTEFFTSDTARFRVVDVLADGVVTENSAKARATWLGGLVTRGLAAEDRARLMHFFPLTPGARFEYDVSSRSDSWHHQINVASDEELSIGNARVRVVRVSRHEKGNAPNRFEGEYTAWFAPDYGFPLKLTYRHISGEAPKFSDWQVVHIVPPGSADGLWRFSLECHQSSYIRLPRVMVRDGVVESRSGTSPSARSVTDSELRLTRTGDQVELRGSSMSAGGDAVVVAARGTLDGQAVSGTGSINTRTGCAFSGERL